MVRAMRILEVPLLLLVVAMNSWINGSVGWAVFITVISMIRLYVNHITYDVNSRINRN